MFSSIGNNDGFGFKNYGSLLFRKNNLSVLLRDFALLADGMHRHLTVLQQLDGGHLVVCVEHLLAKDTLDVVQKVITSVVQKLPHHRQRHNVLAVLRHAVVQRRALVEVFKRVQRVKLNTGRDLLLLVIVSLRVLSEFA